MFIHKGMYCGNSLEAPLTSFSTKKNISYMSSFKRLAEALEVPTTNVFVENLENNNVLVEMTYLEP